MEEEKYIAKWQQNGFLCKAEIWKNEDGVFEFYVRKFGEHLNRGGYEHDHSATLASAKRKIRDLTYPPPYTRFKKG